jgi:hypothetical protein
MSALSGTIGRLIAKEVQNIEQPTRLGPIDFSIAAACAGYRRELLVLDIEELGQPTSGRCKLPLLKILVLTFLTLPIRVSHIDLLFRLFI